eukprot:SAG31_NODE_431_length_15775_cov_3.350663_10_plen_162_part_00
MDDIVPDELYTVAWATKHSETHDFGDDTEKIHALPPHARTRAMLEDIAKKNKTVDETKGSISKLLDKILRLNKATLVKYASIILSFVANFLDWKEWQGTECTRGDLALMQLIVITLQAMNSVRTPCGVIPWQRLSHGWSQSQRCRRCGRRILSRMFSRNTN